MTCTIYLTKQQTSPPEKFLGIIYKFEEEEWGKIFSDPFKITKNSTVQWFQSRFIIQF